MQYRTLGRTGLSVSVMGLGCGGHSRLGTARGLGEDNAVAIVRRALECGVNFVDTAEAYGTEPVVGRALAEAFRDGVTTRERVVVSTKVSPRQPGGEFRTPDAFMKAAEAGLERLGLDYVDILHLHGIDADDYARCASDLLPVLQILRATGRIRFLGITEAFGPDPSHRMLTRHALKADCWDVMMVGFNLLNQSARETIFPITQAKGIGVLDMFAVRRALHDRAARRDIIDHLIADGQLSVADFGGPSADPLAFLTEDGIAESVPEAAYRFCRDEPGIDVVLSGTGNVAHVDENVAALEAPPLPPEIAARLRRMFAGIDSVSGN